MKKTSLRLCPICSCNLCEVLHTLQFVLPDGNPLQSSYDVVCCEHCGFIYADITVPQKDYDAFYLRFSKYEDTSISTGGGKTTFDAKRLQRTATCIADSLPDRKARIMDIGCATGGLLKSLKAMGYQNLVGLDPSPTCVSRTIANVGIQAFVGSLSSLDDRLEKYDCVILSHVMEHVKDLQNAAVCIKNLMTESGLAYIEVPDATRYTEHLYAPFQDFNTEHINHFSLVGLSNLFSQVRLVPLSQGNRTIYTAPGVAYPVIYTIFTHETTSSHRKGGIFRDTLSLERVKEYIFRSQGMMDKMDARIKMILDETPEILVWGTGQLAMKLLATTCLKEAKIKAFVDGNPINQGQFINEIEVKAPEQIIGLNYPILITSTLHQTEIEATIRKYGLPNKIFSLGVDF